MKKKGFTLVELLAVIAILAILVIIALPNIMSLFNEAKMNSFINETRSIVKGAQNQWMSDSMFDTNEIAYSRVKGSNCTNELKLSGRGELNYYIKINKAGKVTEYYIEDGSYQYSYNGPGLNIEDIEFVQQIAKIDPNSVLTITCEGGSNGNGGSNNQPTIVPVEPYITFANQQVTGEITIGDEVIIGSEHFYVIATNTNETTLLSKYSLYVGGKVTRRCTSADCGTESFTYTKISETDTKYGLQYSSAGVYNNVPTLPNHGDMTGSSASSYGFASFSGTNYWDNSVCVATSSGYSCSGTAGLLGSYANSSNEAGRVNYVATYPYAYNSSMSSNEPTVTNISSCGSNPGASGCGSTSYMQDNGYTIAYYVEEYIVKLRSLGASSNIVGRLLTYEEANNLTSQMKGNQSYWCGSVKNKEYVYIVSKGTSITYSGFNRPSAGTRPVIVVPTTELVL